MQSTNKRPPTKAERAHIERIKSMPGASHNGLHGNRAMWRVMGMDETKALAATVERLMCDV